MTTFFNEQPYFDDFNEDKNYMRVLFKPGYAVQSRELTQLQTILANQIEKFGNHIFKSGSPITGGKISLDDKANYAILDKQYAGVDIVPEDFLNKEVEIVGNSKSVRAKVIGLDTQTETDGSPILVLYYLTGDKFDSGDEIRIKGQNIFATLKSSSAVGRSFVASIQEGVYYFKGHFVKVVPQFLVLSTKYVEGYNSTSILNNPTYKVGIEFDENLVTSEEDNTLLDPAQESFNYQAPGADRFQLATSLAKRDISSPDLSNFFEVLRVVDGKKTKEIDYPIYSEIEKTLARRTYDESGNYTVDPFVLSLDEGNVSGFFNVVLDPGKAYVQGYEFQTTSATEIPVERARSTEDVTDFSISTNYSSYVVLNNVTGVLEINQYPQLDLHCVDRANVNTSNPTAYNSTKVGTLRVSNMDYNDATNSNLGNTHSFIVNIFDSNTAPITGTLGASGHSSTRIVLPASFSSTLTANAYANAYFRITNGAGLTVGPLLILSSNATTINIESGLTFTPGSNTFVIDSDIKIAKSMVQNVSSSIVFAGDVDDDSKENGLTYIKEPLKDKLFFTLPYDAVATSTIDNLDFFVKKVYKPSVSSSSPTIGKISINASGADSFAFYPGSSSELSDVTILDNIICFVEPTSVASPAYGIYPGRVLSLANDNFDITMSSNTSMTVNVGVSGVDATFIITTKINNAEATSTNLRKKQLIPTKSFLHSLVPYELDPTGTENLDILYQANSANKIVVANVGTVFIDSTLTNANNDVGATFFTETQALTDLRTPGKSVSLQVSDVYSIVKIVDSKSITSNVTSAMLNTSDNDITSRYDFNNGQKPTHYDHATIKLKRGAAPPTGKVFVQYKYFRHLAPTGNEGLFTVDSYVQPDSNFSYDNIPKTYDNRINDLVSSRSILDFRPTREAASNNFSGSLNVDPNREASLNYSYYTSRIDQIVIKPSREFFIVKGSPAITPVPAPIESGDMLIYSMFIPAYTSSVKDINVKFFENRRFTMRDVGDIEERIKNLEYYVSLDSLEKETASLKVLDANGLERSKYGFFVDNFKTVLTQATNVDLNNEDYNRNLVEDEELKPASLKRTVDMLFGGFASSGNFRLNGTSNYGVITCNYTETYLNNSSPLQPYATKTQPVAGALFAKFNGRGRLYPDSDVKTDISYLPAVNINPVNGLDEVFKFIGNSLDFINTTVLRPWEFDINNPLARVPDRPPLTDTSVDTITWQENGRLAVATTTRERTFLPAGTNLSQRRIQVGNAATNQELDVVTDVAIRPWIKPSAVLFNSKGLRSNTTFYHFFDSTSIDKNIICPNKYSIENTDGSAISGDILLKEGDSVIVANTTTELTNRRNVISSTGTVSGWDFLWKVSSVDNVNKIIHLVNDFGAAGNVSNNIVDAVNNRFLGSLPSQFSGVTASYRVNSVVEHKSGLTRQNSTSTNQIKLGADAPSVDISGNTINLLHNYSVNPASNSNFAIFARQYTVSSYNTTTKVATLSGTVDSSLRTGSETKNITYSIGRNRSDARGEISGMFLLDSATFRTGQRTFRVTESFNNTFDSEAISYSDSQYLSNSLDVKKTPLMFSTYNVGIGTQTQTLTSDLVLRETISSVINIVDPLAQTFIVDQANYPDGVFLSSVNLFFKNKDSGNIPVSVEIRPTVNGTPHASFWYTESVVVKQPDEVSISDNPSFDDASTITTFTFNTPVYLKPGFYALVVKTDSPEYTVWVAEKGAITVDGALIGTQPYAGTLYKSQNSMEYTPIINEDLMFDIKRCSFTTSTVGTVYFSNDLLSDQINTNTNQALYTLPVDAFRFNQNIINPNESKTSALFSFLSTPYGGSLEVSYRGVSPLVKYYFGEDTLYPVGSRRKEIGAQNDFIVRAQISTTDDRISPVLALTGCSLDIFENFINNAELQFTTDKQDLVVVSGGAGYSNANSITISSTTGENFLANVVVESAANGNVVSINVSSNGSGYVDDFTIVYPNTTSWANITANASIVATTEFSSSGGPCLSRYITKKVTLAEGFDAGDLKVLLDANLPEGTAIHVYYKVLSSDDNTPFAERKYGKMVLASELPPPSINKTEFVELEYRPTLNDGFLNYTDDNGVTYDTFREFSIKITMISSDPSVIPRIKNLRVIAMPGE